MVRNEEQRDVVGWMGLSGGIINWEINSKKPPGSLRRRIISIKDTSVNHTVMVLRFSKDRTSSRVFWYCFKYLLLAKSDKSEIEQMLSTTHTIWIPKFKPT